MKFIKLKLLKYLKGPRSKVGQGCLKIQGWQRVPLFEVVVERPVVTWMINDPTQVQEPFPHEGPGFRGLQSGRGCVMTVCHWAHR